MRELVFGIGLVFTSGTPRDSITPLFRQVLGQTVVFGIPGQVIIWAGIILAGWFLLYKTVFGQQLYATGGNQRCARQSGIKTEKVIILTYVISGVLAALAGLVLGARSGHAGNTMGNGYEFNSIASCVIGGTSFAGGRGGLLGSIGGVLLMTVLQNILNIFGVDPSVYFVVTGLVIAIAMAWGKGGEN
jgi:ribose transport system permease protein